MATKYEALARALRQMILSGTYGAGDLLPTEAVLTERFGVSRQTVRKALEQLAADGLIEKRQGSGSRVTGAVLLTRRRRVAVLLTYPGEYTHPTLLGDMRDVLARSGCEIRVFTTDDRVSDERTALLTILDGGFSGVITESVKTALPDPNLDLYAELTGRGVPAVFMRGACTEFDKVPRVDDGSYDGAYMLTRYLIERGRTKIGGIFKSDDARGHRRYLGFVTALNDSGIPVPDDAIMWFSSEDRRAVLERGETALLRKYIEERTDGLSAVIVYNDEIAYHFIRELSAAHISVPEQLSVVSFDNSHYCTLCPVPMTSLGHDGVTEGTAAAELLLDALAGKAPSERKLAWTLHQRSSG